METTWKLSKFLHPSTMTSMSMNLLAEDAHHLLYAMDRLVKLETGCQYIVMCVRICMYIQ